MSRIVNNPFAAGDSTPTGLPSLDAARDLARAAEQNPDDEQYQNAIAQSLFATTGLKEEEQTWRGRYIQDLQQQAQAQNPNTPQFQQAQEGVRGLLGQEGYTTPAQRTAVQEFLRSGATPEGWTPGSSISDIAFNTSGHPSVTGLGDAMEPYARARYQKAALAIADISEAMGQPGITDLEVGQMRQQFIQAYPDIAETGVIPTPMTSQQAQMLRMEEKKARISVAAREIAEGRVPSGEFMEYDEKGNLRMVEGLREYADLVMKTKKHEAAQADEVQKIRDKRWETEQDILFLDHQGPTDETEEARIDWESKRITLQRDLDRYNSQLSKQVRQDAEPGNDPVKQAIFGYLPENAIRIPRALADAGVTAKDFETRQNAALQSGVAFVIDENDHADLPPGTKYIDAQTGKIGTKK